MACRPVITSQSTVSSSALFCLYLLLPSFPSILSFLHSHLESLLMLPFDSLLTDLLLTANSMESSTVFEETFFVKVLEELRNSIPELSTMSLHIKSPVIQKYWNSHSLETESLNLFYLSLGFI